MARVSVAEVKTANGAVLMRHLCQHWEHRFPVTCGVADGRIELPQAVCLLKAAADGLQIRVELTKTADQGRMETLVEEHLKRFGYREELVFTWRQQE